MRQLGRIRSRTRDRRRISSCAASCLVATGYLCDEGGAYAIGPAVAALLSAACTPNNRMIDSIGDIAEAAKAAAHEESERMAGRR